MPADQQVCVVRYLWTADGVPAALLTTYVPGDFAARTDEGVTASSPSVLNLFQLTGLSVDASATALHLELQAPPPSVARSLRLGAGQPAMIVTIRFDEAAIGRPVALTIAVLRPEMFRMVLQTPSGSRADRDAGNLSGSWTDAVEGWEP
jgi:DNA-binding GntR family transcriptional regulator